MKILQEVGHGDSPYGEQGGAGIWVCAMVIKYALWMYYTRGYTIDIKKTFFLRQNNIARHMLTGRSYCTSARTLAQN